MKYLDSCKEDIFAIEYDNCKYLNNFFSNKPFQNEAAAEKTFGEKFWNWWNRNNIITSWQKFVEVCGTDIDLNLCLTQVLFTFPLFQPETFISMAT